jgi:hypothetical protein
MRTVFNFGEGESPAVFGNTVVINRDAKARLHRRVRRGNGKELWRQPRDEKTT